LADAQMDSERERMLYLVTPDADTIRHLEQLFGKRGFSCRPYRSAGEFLGEGRAANGVVLMASHLPDMSGAELVQHMKKSARKIPTIILSDDADVDSAVEAFRAGAVDFLELPFVDRVLLDRVNDLFERLEDG
jgi:two-component system response regulator FixJ